MIRQSGAQFVVYVYARARDGAAGGRKYVGSYDSKRAAKEAEEESRTKQRQIQRGELAPETDDRRTLDQAVTEWLASLNANRSRSHSAYVIRMNLYILPELGSVPISRLTRPQVMRWRDGLAARLGVSTVNGSLTCLSSAFSYFVKQQWVDLNPCHGIERAKHRRIYEWVKTKAEITKLLIECPKGIREIVTVGVTTGMRLDELLHLQWVDIDLPNRLITVHRGRQGTTKSGEPRYVPILDSLLPFLRDLQLHRGGAQLVFPGAGGKVRSKVGVRVPFKQAAARAGLSAKLRFHDATRHTFASHWVLDRGDIFRLSKILGHSSVVITQKTYAHLVPEMWEQDYHRVAFNLPNESDAYGITKRPQLVAV